MALHYTAISRYKMCPRCHQYAEVFRFVARGPQVKLWVGEGGHLAVAAYHTGKTTDPAQFLANWVAEQTKALGSSASEVPQKVWDEAAIVQAVLALYPDWAEYEYRNFKFLDTEVKVEVPVTDPEGGLLCAVDEVQSSKFDAIATDEMKSIWLFEHKFLAQTPNPEALQLDEQCGLYLLAAKQKWPELRFKGVVYNVLRKTDPKRARTAIFWTHQTVRSQAELRTLELNRFRIWCTMKNDNWFIPSPGLHCTWKCAYRELCNAENQGDDPAKIGPLMYDVKATKPTEEAREE